MFFTREPEKKAIAYYRHSAEDKQENSVAIQQEHTHKFAQANSIQIIHEEADEDKSGLSANRHGFDQLFKEWILNPDAPDFDYVLVYDVSRWGRFQDPDEAAFWEFRCKNEGKQVIFVSMGFPKEEQQLMSSLQISIQRYMAADFSKQLSEKVFHGSVKVSEQGFSAGGTAPYGMIRMLLDEARKPIQTLRRGEHKVIANQRVIFAPADDKTTETVKVIFALFVNYLYTPEKIASNLNDQSIPSPNGGKWNKDKVIRILTNETYTGTRIYNKTWNRLRQKRRPNPRNEWVVCPNAFEAIINKETFHKAQERLYWSTLRMWKQGAYVSNNVYKLFRKELVDFLKTLGEFNEEKLLWIQHQFSIIVSSCFYKERSIPAWCFTIKEQMKQQEYILGVAIEKLEPKQKTSFFLIPTHDFGLGNFFIMSSEHPKFQTYSLDSVMLKEKIQDLYQNLIN